MARVRVIPVELAKPDAYGRSARKTREEVRAFAVDALRRVTTLVDAKGGADADGFKRWLATLGERVAQAATEGSFLGIGGTRVSDKEESTLAEIRTALGVRA